MAKTIYEIRVVAQSENNGQTLDVLRMMRRALAVSPTPWAQASPSPQPALDEFAVSQHASPSSPFRPMQTPWLRVVLLAALGLFVHWNIEMDKDRLTKAEQAASANIRAINNALKTREAQLLKAENALAGEEEKLQTKQTEMERQVTTVATSWQSASQRLNNLLETHKEDADAGMVDTELASKAQEDEEERNILASAWKIDAIQQQFHLDRQLAAQQLAAVNYQEGEESVAQSYTPEQGMALRRAVRQLPRRFYDTFFEITHSNPALSR